MNLNTIDEAIEILQAMKEGKKIEYYEDIGQRWHELSSSVTSIPYFATHTYRVKPEPKHDWVVEYVRPHTPGRKWYVYHILYDGTENEVNQYIMEQAKSFPWEYRYRKVEAVS